MQKTDGLILTIYTSYDVFPRRMCLLEVLLIMLPIYGVKSPKTHILEAWIGVFKPNAQILKLP